MPHDSAIVPPPRPPRGAPDQRSTEARLFLPPTKDGILEALCVEEGKYEVAKANLAALEEQKLDLTEERESVKSGILEEVAKTAYPSVAARERAEKDAMAHNARMQEIDQDDAKVRFYLIRANEDVSVFRHRMLTLRSALDALSSETLAKHFGSRG